MKIAFLARELDDTGATTHMLMLGQWLLKNGHSVFVLCNGDIGYNTEIVGRFKKTGFDVRYVNFPTSEEKNLKGILKVKLIPKILSTLFTGIKELRKIKPDIIHIHYPFTSYIASIYKLFFNIPIILTVHHNNISLPKYPVRYNELIVVSEEVKQRALKVFKYSEDVITLIGNGVNPDIFDLNITKSDKLKMKKELGFDQNKLLLLFVGSINYRKGIDLLLEACSIVEKKAETKFELVLVGNGDLEWAKALIKKLSLKIDINFRNYQDPLPFYKSADIFVLPSRLEGAPMVIAEAMMVGLPVIRSRSEGADEQIHDGISGLLFENENVKQLSSKLLMLIKDEKLRENISKEAKNRANMYLSTNKMGAKTLEVYKKNLD